jgi:hypothetical protein
MTVTMTKPILTPDQADRRFDSAWGHRDPKV